MKQTFLVEVDLEKPIPDLASHIENRISTMSAVRMVTAQQVESSQPKSIMQQLGESVFGARCLPFPRKS